MGTACTSYCSKSDEQNEVNDDDSQQSNKVTTIEKQTAPEVRASQTRKALKSGAPQAEDNLDKIVLLQSIVRGFLERRKYRVLKLNYQISVKYFKVDEGQETLLGTFDPNNKQIEVREFTYKSGAVYKGDWLGGMRHGKGTMEWTDKARYEGTWDLNQAQGQGMFYHADGDVYDGQWHNNKANGKGIYQNIKGARYEGCWKNDQQDGGGVETWPEGSKYEGQYVLGKKEGHGKYTWADLATYEGDWLDNKINGYGIYLWADGRKYYGSWSNNDMQGYGIYIYSDGVRYDGQYLNDKKEGFGVYYWTDGRKYDGWWHRGKQHGVGTYVDTQKQSQKYGLWEVGKRVKWFMEQEVEDIESQKISITQWFSDPDKSSAGLKENSGFKKPVDFDDQMTEMKKVLRITFN